MLFKKSAFDFMGEPMMRQKWVTRSKSTWFWISDFPSISAKSQGQEFADSQKYFINFIWDKVFKSVLSNFFKGYLPQNLLSPLLNTLSQLTFKICWSSHDNPFYFKYV